MKLNFCFLLLIQKGTLQKATFGKLIAENYNEEQLVAV